jgi:hypothetical protein
MQKLSVGVVFEVKWVIGFSMKREWDENPNIANNCIHTDLGNYIYKVY